jgi:hypothetical protein
MLPLKVHYYIISVCLLNFTFQSIFLFNLTILIHKYFCQIDDFTMCLWHLNKIHFVENPKRDKSEPLKCAFTLYEDYYSKNMLDLDNA